MSPAAIAPENGAHRPCGAFLTLAVEMLPPTVNHMYVSTGRGGKALTAEAQTWRTMAGLLARQAAGVQGWALPAGARLAATIALTFPTKRRTDLDNFAKAALDAVALALGFDDSRIDRLTLERTGRGAARTVITLEVLP